MDMRIPPLGVRRLPHMDNLRIPNRHGPCMDSNTHCALSISTRQFGFSSRPRRLGVKVESNTTGKYGKYPAHAAGSRAQLPVFWRLTYQPGCPPRAAKIMGIAPCDYGNAQYAQAQADTPAFAAFLLPQPCCFPTAARLAALSCGGRPETGALGKSGAGKCRRPDFFFKAHAEIVKRGDRSLANGAIAVSARRRPEPPLHHGQNGRKKEIKRERERGTCARRHVHLHPPPISTLNAQPGRAAGGWPRTPRRRPRPPH